MQQWEYKKIYATSVDDFDLNELGGEGWELIVITESAYHNAPLYIFKRPKQNFDYVYRDAESVQTRSFATKINIAGVQQVNTSKDVLSRDEIVQHFVALASAIPKGTYYGVGVRVKDLSTGTKVEISLHQTLVENIQAAFKMFDDGFFTWSYRVSDWQVDYFKSS